MGMDLSKLSDDEIQAIMNGKAAPSAGPDLSKLTDEQIAKLAGGAPGDQVMKDIEASKSWQDRQIPIVGGTPRGYALGLADSLPIMGAGAGGAVAGGTTFGLGTLAGGAGGYAVGKTAQNLIRPYIEGKNVPLMPQGTVGETVGNVVKGTVDPIIEGATNEMGGQVVGKAGGAMIRGAADKLQSLGETKAFKAAGAIFKDFKQQFIKSPERINELGRTMLDNNLVKAGDTVEDVARRSLDFKNQTGKQIGDTYTKVLDTTITDPASPVAAEHILAIKEAGFHPHAQMDELKSMIANKFKGEPGSTGAISKAHQVIDELAMNGNNITPERALELKGGIDSMIDWSKKATELPIEQEALKEVRTFIQGRLNGQVALMDQVLNTTQSKELVRLNRLYGNVADVANIARDNATRLKANQSFGLTDKIIAGSALSPIIADIVHGGGGHSIPAALVGLTAVGANKAARTYGNALTAVGSDAVASGMNKMIDATNPQVMGAIGRKAIQLQQQGKGGQ